MLLSILIFSFYLILFSWIITRISFFKSSGLSGYWLIFLFIAKIVAGAVYAWFYLQPGRIETSDTWRYFNESLAETDWLLRDPAGFFSDIFRHGYQSAGSLFEGENSYWNNLKTNIIIKLLAVCNVFTLKTYFANLVIFNFIFLFGPVALYKLAACKLQSKTPKLVLIATIFFIPSFLFWCSGVHKDGLIFTCLTLIIIFVYDQFNLRKVNIGKVVIAISSFLLLFFLRNFMAILLLPALLVWLLAAKFPRKGVLFAAIVYGAGLGLFFISSRIGLPDFPSYVIEKQGEFKQLEGGSQIVVPALENTIGSFVRFFPTAVDIAFLRPHPSEIQNASYIPAVAENFLLLMILLVAVVRHRKTVDNQLRAFHLFCICFSVSFLLLAGYTVTFSGAVVRYKASVLPLLFLPVIQGVDFWSRRDKSKD